MAGKAGETPSLRPYQRVEGGGLGSIGHVVAIALRAAIGAPIDTQRRGRVELMARGCQQPALIDRAVHWCLGRGGRPGVGQRAATGFAARAQGVGGHQELGERGAARKGGPPSARLGPWASIAPPRPAPPHPGGLAHFLWIYRVHARPRAPNREEPAHPSFPPATWVPANPAQGCSYSP